MDEADSAQLLFMTSYDSLLPGCFRRGYWLSLRLGLWVLPKEYWYWILLAASFPYPVQYLVRLWILFIHQSGVPACTFFYVTLYPAVTCSVPGTAEEYKKFESFFETSTFAALLIRQ